ncbi:MAG: hypothetical protein AAF799_25090 [Myxococcota bacterium]
MGDGDNEAGGTSGEAHLATIALRQVRVSRDELRDKELRDKKSSNVMNRLVPYLDLFGRLTDGELARLAEVPVATATNLRKQVIQVDRALERFTDLLPRLSDAELVRLTAATAKTIRFWRLCQPKSFQAAVPTPAGGGFSVAAEAEKLGQGPASDEPIDSGAPLPRNRSGSSKSRATAAADARVSSMPPNPTERSGAHPRPQPVKHEPSGRHSISLDPPSGPHHEAIVTDEDTGSFDEPSGTWLSAEDTQEVVTPRPAPYRMPTGERDSGPSRNRAGGSERSGARPAASVDQGFSAAAAAAAAAARGGDSGLLQRPRPEAMDLSGTPFPGYDANDGSEDEDDGIFIGLELPDPPATGSHDPGA